MYLSRLDALINLLRAYEHDAAERGDSDGVQAAIEMGHRVARQRNEISVKPQDNPVLTPREARMFHEWLSA